MSADDRIGATVIKCSKCGFMHEPFAKCVQIGSFDYRHCNYCRRVTLTVHEDCTECGLSKPNQADEE